MSILRSELTAPSTAIATSNNAALFNQALSAQNMPKRSLTPTDRSSSPPAQRQRTLNPEQTRAIENYTSDGAEAMQRARIFNQQSLQNQTDGNFTEGYWDLDYAQDNAFSASRFYKNAFVLSGENHHREKADEALHYSGEILFEKHTTFLENSENLQRMIESNDIALKHVPVSTRKEILTAMHEANKSKETMLVKMDSYSENSTSVQDFVSSVLETASRYEAAGKQFATNYALYGHNRDYLYASKMFSESESIYYEMHNAYSVLMQSQRAERLPHSE